MTIRRQIIIDRIATLLGTIVTGATATVESDEGSRTHTYETTLSGKVFELLSVPLEKPRLPAVVFGETEAAVEYPGKDSQYKINRLRVFFRLHVQQGTAGGANLRKAMNDVIAAMASERQLSNRFGGAVQSIKLLSNRIEFDEQGQWLGTGVLDYELVYQNGDDEL
jgi:hypothetical protein